MVLMHYPIMAIEATSSHTAVSSILSVYEIWILCALFQVALGGS